MKFKINPNVLVFFGGCLFCLIIWFAIEGGLWAYEKMTAKPVEAPTYPKTFFKQDEFGIFEARQGRHLCYHKGPEGKLLYEQTYPIDEFGRRETPVEPGERDRYILFFGCSYTFGEGIGQEQTLPYHVGGFAPRYRPYNYGMMGLGPYDALAKIENIDLKKEVKEPKGIFIYLFMADHMGRIMGNMDVMTWNFNGCYYEMSPEGKLVRKGDYRSGRPLLTKLYRLLSKSRILRALNINLPFRIGDNDLHRIAEAAQAMDEAVKRKYPESEFYTVLYPGPHPDRLAQYIQDKGVKVLDYSKLFSCYDPLYYIAEADQHPSNLAYQTIAEHIVKDLQLDKEDNVQAR